MKTLFRTLAWITALTASACGSASSTPIGSPPPQGLAGVWTSGRGGTMVTYDQITGTSSPISSGLAFRFAQDGTYVKAFRSTNGGSCGMVLIGTESGGVIWKDGTFELHASHGEAISFASCTPSAVAKSVLSASDLDNAAYSWTLDSDRLTITRVSDSASAVFDRSQ